MTYVSSLVKESSFTSDELTLADVVSVRSSFHRSANIETDIGSTALRQSYALNQIANEHASSIFRDIASPRGVRAWAITGPFGSGKSSFAAFLADVLANPETIPPEYQALRKENGLNNERYSVIPIVGHRASIREHLARAFSIGENTSFELNSTIDRLISRAEASGNHGVLIILDEFNRVLDYEARHPWESDMGLLQSLAERAARSDGKLLLMTVQHMSFADYAGSGAMGSISDEWRKIQGRFRDISFFLPHMQSLELMGKALQSDVPIDHSARERHTTIVHSLLHLAPIQRIATSDTLESSWPIHPITAIVATELFRSKLAQNERSMFAFLASQEPSAFQAFLLNEPFSDSTRLFGLSSLFDYVVSTVGAAANIGVHGQAWAQVQQHCDTVEGQSTLHEDLIKATFLLNRYGGPVGLQATSAILALAHDGHAVSRIEAALDDLVRQGILRKRLYRGDFTLTSGSGYDFEAELERARTHVNAFGVSDRLKNMPSAQLRRTARRHYVRTGNLRTYAIEISDTVTGDDRRPKARIPADLEIHYIVPESRDQALAIRHELESEATERRTDTPRIYAVVREPEPVHQVTIDVAAVTWLLDHDKELDDDAARREVMSFLDDADARALDLVGPLFGWGGHRLDPALCYWIAPESENQPTTAMDMHRIIDSVLSDTYSLAPEFRNELINRNAPSSAAARARRELITAMVLREREERFGITGHPPEAAIYETLLRKEGFHRQGQDGQWHLARPNGTWGQVWDAITKHIDPAVKDHVPLSSVGEMLTSPPFGLKHGPIPIVIAAYLIARQDSVSLFENGTFVAALRPEVFERMLRSFEGFSLRSLPADGIQNETLGVLRQVIVQHPAGQSTPNSQAAVVETVRSVLSVVTTLPQFSRRTKQFLDHPSASKVRETALRSQDPQQLLLEDLPQALGFASIETREEQEKYAQELRAALISLETAYERMLGYIAEKTREFVGFGESDITNGTLFNRMMPLHGKRPRGPLGQLIAALAMTAGDWRENVGRAVLDGKPTLQWDDRDVTTFEIRVHQLAATLLDLEALVGEQQRDQTSSTVASVSLIDRSGRFEHVRRTIAIDPGEEASVRDAAREMVSMLQSRDLSESGIYAALAGAMAIMRQDVAEESQEERGQTDE